jgi:hypothetical protein
LLAADPVGEVLTVYPVAVVDQLLVTRWARCGDSDGGVCLDAS